MPHNGSCLCNQTKIKIDSTHTEQIVCHCRDCKETSGSAFGTSVLALKKDVTITGPVREYTSTAASGKTVTRIFCSNCGSAISQLATVFGDTQAIQTGNFREFADVPIKEELFVKDRWSVLESIKGAEQVQGMPEI
ncbi:Mss4-like protein [Mycena rebaudengoi]|nr:Mss4-like protein [Mycena rebaudengoi]